MVDSCVVWPSIVPEPVVCTLWRNISQRSEIAGWGLGGEQPPPNAGMRWALLQGRALVPEKNRICNLTVNDYMEDGLTPSADSREGND